MKNNKLLLIGFIVIIYGVLLSYPIKMVLVKLNKVSINTLDNYQEFIPKNEKNIIDKLDNKINRIKTSIENKVTNYFPLYMGINSLYRNTNYYLNSTIYKDIPIKKNVDGEYIFLDSNNDFYYLKNKYDEEEINNRLNKQVNFFNNLSNNIDLYIYIPTRYELTSLSSSNYVSEFKNKLNNNIHVDNLKVNNIDQYLKYFYKTDHHWTMYGAYNGYKDIMNMFGIDALNNLNIVEKKERKFLGSNAKNALNNKYYDYISDLDINLKYSVLVNGKEKDNLFKPREIRLDRSYEYYDYYVQYFNGQYGNIIYDYNNPSKENLLIMSDSYAWQIDYLIAASFNKTHVINLRYDEYKNKNFDLNKYVKDNNISKVLFLYSGEATIFDNYNYDFVGRVK